MAAITSAVQGFDLPDTWRRKRIKYVATYNDEALSDDTDEFKDIEYIEISGVSLVGGVESTSELQFHAAPSRARRVVRSGDTLVSTVRTYLKAIATVREAPDNLIASTGFCVIRPGEEIDAAFLGWAMKSEPIVGEIVARSVGVSYPATNASEVVKLEAPLPDIDTQRRIAGYLDDKTARIDALIERKRALLDRLAEKRQALITRAITCGLTPASPLKDSGIDWLGKVPAHWEVWPLKRYLTESQYGISEALSEAGEVAILRMGNIQNLGIDLTELKFVDEVAPFLLLQENDVLFNRTNSIDLVGKSAIYKGTYDGALSFASYLARFRFDGRYLPEFANFVFGTEQLLEYGRTMAFRAIGQANLNPTRFAEIAVPVPPVEEQQAIIDFLTPHGDQTDEVASQIAASIEKLAEYRAALVTAAVTGKIKALLTDPAPAAPMEEV
jgi:type I restriction enzyme S subunit